MSKIKIVTAFFDIGRDKSSVYPRSNDQYFDYFKFWAGIKNELIVYCDPCDVDRIYKIRKEYGLEDRTEIIAIEDVYAIEPEMFARMCKVEKDESFRSFRYYNNALSNTSKYDYIMFLKWWFVADAAKREKGKCLFAWVDFGYNHGDAKYTNSENFRFEWDFDFPDKINAFCLSNPNEMSLIDSLQFQKDCFIGASVIIPQQKCAWYWQQIKDAMNSLLNVGCIDDDQHLQLMVYKKNKDEYSLVQCDWFDAFELCSNQQFEVRKKADKSQIIPETAIKTSFMKRIYRKLVWCYRRVTDPDYPHISENPFISRMKEKMMKYYEK